VNKIRDESDPIEMSRKRILDRRYASEDDLKEIEKRVRDIVTDSADFATNSPEPDAAELWTDVYR